MLRLQVSCGILPIDGTRFPELLRSRTPLVITMTLRMPTPFAQANGCQQIYKHCTKRKNNNDTFPKARGLFVGVPI